MNKIHIDNIKEYWENNPLLSIELEQKIGTKEYFLEHERISDDIAKNYYDLWGFTNNKGKKILDIGCGPGYFVRKYAQSGADVIGVDLTQKAVDLTNKSLKIFGLKGNAIIANAEQLPFINNEFDFISSAGVLHHTPNTQQAIDEMYRVLKPGGKAVISLYYKNIFMSKTLWPITRFFLKMFFGNVKGRSFKKVQSVEDLIRLYDGDNNPLGKAYSKKEVKKMFEKFKIQKVGLYYFPIRFLNNSSLYKIIKPFGRIFDERLGLMIYIKVQK